MGHIGATQGSAWVKELYKINYVLLKEIVMTTENIFRERRKDSNTKKEERD